MLQERRVDQDVKHSYHPYVKRSIWPGTCSLSSQIDRARTSTTSTQQIMQGRDLIIRAQLHLPASIMFSGPLPSFEEWQQPSDPKAPLQRPGRTVSA